MKTDRKYVLIAALCMTAVLTACTPPQTDKALSLTEKGLALIGAVDTLAECEEYSAIHTASEEIADAIKEIADNDYTAPEAVFKLENFDKIVYDTMFSDTKLPKEIEEKVKGKFAASLPSRINAMDGTTTLAVTAILSYSDSFIYEDLQVPVTYLYTFGNEYSFMVTFVPDDESIVNAAVSVIISGDMGHCTTTEEVKMFFKDTLGIEDVSVSAAEEE